MFQNGQRVCFKNGGDPARIQKVQLAYGKDRSRAPQVIPTTDPSATQVQVVTGEDAARYPFIDPIGLIGAPAAWFRAGVGQTVTGAGVSTWADQSGNGRDLLQGTDAARPALQADGSVLFNGTSHYLKCNAFTLNQPETVYIAFKQVSWTALRSFLDGNANSTMLLQQLTATPNIRAFAGAGSTESSSLAVGAYGVVCTVFNGASSVLKINNVADITGNFGALNGGGITLGANATPANYSNIQVLEVLVFSTAHDATQRARIISYLAGRHGIAL